jgi:hypothetical protein
VGGGGGNGGGAQTLHTEGGKGGRSPSIKGSISYLNLFDGWPSVGAPAQSPSLKTSEKYTFLPFRITGIVQRNICLKFKGIEQ